VYHKDVFLIWESSPRVWEDVPAESREFVKKYLESYPERPMVKLQCGQMVKTEWKGKWWLAKVTQVDASLVQMHFEADGRTEWIYRGSTRLGPLFLEVLKANARQHPQLRNTHSRHRLPVTSNVNQLISCFFFFNVETLTMLKNVETLLYILFSVINYNFRKTTCLTLNIHLMWTKM